MPGDGVNAPSLIVAVTGAMSFAAGWWTNRQGRRDAQVQQAAANRLAERDQEWRHSRELNEDLRREIDRLRAARAADHQACAAYAAYANGAIAELAVRVQEERLQRRGSSAYDVGEAHRTGDHTAHPPPPPAPPPGRAGPPPPWPPPNPRPPTP